MTFRYALLALFALAGPILAGERTLRVEPDRIDLRGKHAARQLIVTLRDADGRDRDLTADATFEPPSVISISRGYAEPTADGEGVLVVKAAGQTVRVPVTVKDTAELEPVSFRRQVVPAMSVAGCNAGACHGTPSGKNGFKLSLRGFDPEADFRQLTREVSARRVSRTEPLQSLVLLKGEGRLPHEGGARLLADTVPDRAVRDWLTGGLPGDPADLPALKRVEVLPGPRILAAPDRLQQLAVLAHFADGSVRDVTRLTVYRSSDDGVAKVNAEGRVEFATGGEVAVQVRYLDEMATVRLTRVDIPKDYRWIGPEPANFVDEHLFTKRKLLGIPSSEEAGDAEFVRRAYLDVCGILPTPSEVERFLADTDADKRGKLVDSLLERPEFADFWAFKWADLLANNRRAIQAKGVYLYHQWLRDHFANNTGFDKVARELLTASGSTFLNPPANYFRNDRKVRPADDLAQNTAQLFLGIRMSCAKCHNHPFERWTQDDYYGLAAFFARVQDRSDLLYPRFNRFNLGALEIHHARSGEVIHPRTGKPAVPRFLGGELPVIGPNEDRRGALAEWITRKDNPFFARSVVNRVWFHLNGKGIVDPVDDFRDSNPAASEELLNALAKDFADHGYDVKRLIRTITASRTYRLSSATTALNRPDERYFSHATARLHGAEVLLDALSAATDVPEEFLGVPAGTRAVQLPESDQYHHPFLKAFGQPARETACECERSGDSSLGHALQLINGPTVKAKLSHPKNRIGRLLAAGKPPEAILREVYLATVSRPPSPAEAEKALRYVADTADARTAWEDVQWALLNSKEFLLRH